MPLRYHDSRIILFTLITLGVVSASLGGFGCDRGGDRGGEQCPTPATDDGWLDACAAVTASTFCCEGETGPRIVQSVPVDVCFSLTQHARNKEALSVCQIEACASVVDPCSLTDDVCVGYRNENAYRPFLTPAMCDAIATGPSL